MLCLIQDIHTKFKVIFLQRLSMSIQEDVYAPLPILTCRSNLVLGPQSTIASCLHCGSHQRFERNFHDNT
jgi:RNase P subunit RPR2